MIQASLGRRARIDDMHEVRPGALDGVVQLREGVLGIGRLGADAERPHRIKYRKLIRD